MQNSDTKRTSQLHLIMKKTLFILICLLSTSMCAQYIQTGGFIYSQGGFKVMRTQAGSFGLYTSDGKMLVALSASPSFTSDITREVCYGTELLGPHSLQCPLVNNYAATASGEELTYKPYFRVVLPSTVEYIHVDAFDTNCFYLFEINDQRTSVPPTNIQMPTYDRDSEEQARYNTIGQRLREPQPGVNIVSHDDGTSEKVLRGR